MASLTKIPKSEDFIVKPKFEERYKELLGDRYEEFMKFSLSFMRKGIRVNTNKATVEKVVKSLSENWHLTPVPWCKEGFWIDHKGIGDEKRFDIGNTLEHQLGYIYVQEPASMIPPVVLEPKKGETILDMCAAPGSKTSQMSAMMENSGALLANDSQSIRLKPLGINLQRTGCANVIVTLMSGNWFRKAGIEFDRVLVDAPCSGTGTIRKSPATLKMWGEGLVRRMCNDQKKLIRTAFEILKPGGVMVYSTCTLEPEENEGVVNYLLNEEEGAQIEEIKLDIKRSDAVTEFGGVQYNPEVKKCLRIYPQDNDTEGFFVCKIRKAQ